MKPVNMLLAAVLPLAAAASPADGTSPVFDTAVPFNAQMVGIDKTADELKAIRAKTGFRRFFIIGPGFNSVMYAPFPAAVYSSIGDDITKIAAGLKDTDIRLSWWCTPSIRYVSDFPPIEDALGNKSVDNKKCPLDEKFADDWAAKIRSVIERADPKPEFVVIEDDYTLSWGRGLMSSGACYCERHLKLFERIYGKRLERDEIWAAYTNRTAANLPVRRAFAKTIKESLVILAARIRAEIDKVDENIRVLLCESAGETDGDSTEAVLRAFAGGTRPAIRQCGAIYSAETTPADIPAAVSHAVWTTERLPKDIETFYESDTYPHNRFYSSASLMISMMSGVLMAGSADFMFYCTQYLDDPLEDEGYATAFNALKPRLEAVRRFIVANDAKLTGARIVYKPDLSYLIRGGGGEGVWGGNILKGASYMFSKFGLPYTTRTDAQGPALLVGLMPDAFDDAELKRILSGGVFIDAQAAETIAKRGFSHLLGADVKRVKRLPALGEKILPASGCTARGKRMNASFIFNAGAEGSSQRYVELKPHPGTEVLSTYLDRQDNPLAPSFTYFENSLGGRVAMIPVALCGNRTSSIYNLRKQELVRRVFARLAGDRPLDIVALNSPGIWILANVSKDDRKMMVMINNLSGDERDGVKFEIGAQWHGAKVSRLQADGSGKPVCIAGKVFTADKILGVMKPEFYLFEK